MEIVEQNHFTIKKLESNLSLSKAEILSLKIEAEKHSATILNLKSEQLKDKHQLDILTESLAELEDLRQKLRNTDDVIGRLATNVADKGPFINDVTQVGERGVGDFVTLFMKL